MPKEPDVDDLLDRFLVIGTPDTCIRQLKRIQELVGITHFNCSFWFGDVEHPRVLKSMELFAKEVMPASRWTKGPTRSSPAVYSTCFPPAC